MYVHLIIHEPVIKVGNIPMVKHIKTVAYIAGYLYCQEAIIQFLNLHKYSTLNYFTSLPPRFIPLGELPSVEM